MIHRALIALVKWSVVVEKDRKVEEVSLVEARTKLLIRFRILVSTTWWIMQFSGILVLVFLFPVLLWFKPGSTDGRMLIHKVSFNILKDNWIWGIGNGQFKAKYNEYQADYFSNHRIDSREALLADNTFYAFNDYLQLIIENGIIVFFFGVIALFLLIRQIRQVKTTPVNKPIFIASTASLICILTASFFSYPLQVFPIIVQATFCLAIMNFFLAKAGSQISLSPIAGKCLKVIIIIASILLLTHSLFLLDYKIVNNRAFNLSITGYKMKSIEKYRALSKSYINDGNTLFQYAKELYYTKQFQEAGQVLQRAKEQYCTNEVYQLSAKIFEELENDEEAEKN